MQSPVRNFQWHDTWHIISNFSILSFTPPRDVLGANSQWTLNQGHLGSLFSSNGHMSVSFMNVWLLSAKPLILWNPHTIPALTCISLSVNLKSVNNYLSGVCNNLWGYFPNVRTARNSSLVTQTLAGCKWLYGLPSPCKRALTRDDLLTVYNQLAYSESHNDLLFLTQLLSSFNALFLLGELVWPDKIAHRSFHKLSLWTSVHSASTWHI